MTPRASGRRPGGSSAREDILASARKLFADKGFDGVSLRAIAGDAGVDVALISHYFDNKRGLFLATVALPVDPAEVLKPLAGAPDEDLARTLLTQFLEVWDGPSSEAVLATFRTAIAGGESELARSFVSTLVFDVLRDRLAGADDLELRLGLAATQISGIIMVRKVIRLEPIASMPAPRLVDLIAPNLQRYFTGPLPRA
ncbi:TetR/AcrR family transcriptional regulator [Calidifontibacter sp. DB0510]|uniref:TetR/AcrR family transcriptional regulator n=1 Tax=Metallococcus carri TaxID=1656884 RepID=A0A967B1W3_9MICO|nr:TetR family transcriptional regulator [Metallococcus carri]NHN56469.1 TetR/AcrR family transcriptional regulator [Metallococcus carri]NOP36093.1 TetR/AcrR family transcriptional regulator [Calidifontibacter sp. DB2511S]